MSNAASIFSGFLPRLTETTVTLTGGGGGGGGPSTEPWILTSDTVSGEPIVRFNPIAADQLLVGDVHTSESSSGGTFLFFDSVVTLGSFRAGTVTGTQWQAANRGVASVAFGYNNQAAGDYSAALGGASNLIVTATSPFCAFSTISGGQGNSVSAGTSGSPSTSEWAFIGGGKSNTVNTAIAGTNSDSIYATIVGGFTNAIVGEYCAIVGGSTNSIITTQASGSVAAFGFIGGGSTNHIYSGGLSVGASSRYSLIGGGSTNTISANTDGPAAADYAVIAGGQGNTVLASWGAVPGGYGNTASGTYSFAAGQAATASSANSFVWGGTGTAVSDSGVGTVTFGCDGFYTTGGIATGVNGVDGGSLKFFALGTGFAQLKLPSSVASYQLTLPTGQGAAYTTLVNDGTGVLSWADGGGVPGVFIVLPSMSVATVNTAINSGLYNIVSWTPGSYTYNGVINVATSGVTLLGNGATINMTAATNQPQMWLGQLSATPSTTYYTIRVQGFIFNGAGQTAQFGSTYPYAANNNVTISLCGVVTITECTAQLAASGGIIFTNSCYDCSLTDSVSLSQTYDGAGAYASSALTFSNLECYNNGASGLTFDNAVSNIDISNCGLFSNTANGLFARNASNVSVVGCNILSNTQNGMFLSGYDASPDLNIIAWTISGNVIVGNGGAGLYLQSVQYSSISGNTIRGNTGNGINITSYGSPHQAYGVSVALAITGNTVTGNANGLVNAASNSSAYGSGGNVLSGNTIVYNTTTQVSGDFTGWSYVSGGLPGDFARGMLTTGGYSAFGCLDSNVLLLQTNNTTRAYIDTAGTATFLGNVFLGVASSAQQILFFLNAASPYAVGITGAATGASWTCTLPPTAGTAGQVLSTTGGGVLVWSTPSYPWLLGTDSSSGVAQVRYNPAATNQLLVGNTTTAESATGGTFLFFNSGAASGDAGSFRAGTTTGTQWQAASRGAYSVAFGYNNTASGEYSFCAGSGNTTSGPGSFIGGGVGSTIGGTFTGNTICGGGDHSITGASGSSYNFIGGGYNNTHSTATSYNTIAGGQGNTTYVSEWSFIGGGSGNTSNGGHSSVVGGNSNTIAYFAGTGSYSFIGGGSGNNLYTGNLLNVASNYSAIVAGSGNSINTNVSTTTLNSSYSFIGAGASNNITAQYGVIGGGNTNNIHSTQGTGSIADDCFIGGGASNNIYSGGTTTGASSQYSVICGGYLNAVNDTSSAGLPCAGSFIGAGTVNKVFGEWASIVGGSTNTIGVTASAGANYAFIGGGASNGVTGTYGMVGGGYSNTAAAAYGCVPGGTGNIVTGTGGFCCGNGALDGTIANRFVWADQTGFNTSTSSLGLTGLTPGTDSVWWGCGTGTATGSPVFSIYTTGTRTGLGVSATLAAGSTAWAALCSREAKENIVAVDPLDMLRRVDALGIYEFNYKGAPAGFTCRGPRADEWAGLFPSAKDANRIETMDLDAAALGAIKGLSQLVRSQAERIAALEARFCIP